MIDDKFKYHEEVDGIVTRDVHEVLQKDVSYGASWKKRGGVGAFMMLARKWDRLETMMEENGYRLIEIVVEQRCDVRDGSILAEIRDLRRYLLLVEAEAMHQVRGLRAGSEVITSRLGSVAIVDGVDDGFKDGVAAWTDVKEGQGERIVGVVHVDLPLERHSEPPPEMAALYESVGAGLWQLCDVPIDVHPSHVNDLGVGYRYITLRDPIDDKWYVALDRRQIPDIDSWRLVNCPHEMNKMEFDEVVEPALRGLYEWDGGGGKWSLRPEYRAAWCAMYR